MAWKIAGSPLTEQLFLWPGNPAMSPLGHHLDLPPAADFRALAAAAKRERIDLVVGMESRGFIFSAPMAYRLGAGMVPIRKLGKLPAETVTVEYSLEYGTNTLEVHRDAIAPGQRVQVRLEEEKYVKDGEQKTVLRVKRYSPAEADEAF